MWQQQLQRLAAASLNSSTERRQTRPSATAAAAAAAAGGVERVTSESINGTGSRNIKVESFASDTDKWMESSAPPRLHDVVEDRDKL